MSAEKSSVGVRSAEQKAKGYSLSLSELRLKKDLSVQSYLKDVLVQLQKSTLPQNEVNYRLYLLDDRGGQWSSFALEKDQLFLSWQLLKQASYENEIAGILAIQQSHLQNQHELSQTRPARYSEQDERVALKAAVGTLYFSGYDPRGIVSLLRLYEKNPELSVFSSDELGRMIDQVWGEIAVYPPLRNPLIRTKQFYQFQKRIQLL